MSVDNPVAREAGPPTDAASDVRSGVVYGAYYFAHDCGVPYEYNEHWIQFFATIAERIVTELHPSSVLDAGCAIGMLVEALRSRGVDAFGIDVSEWAMANLAPGAVGHCRHASLAEPIGGPYDLVTCIEVIEHIPEPDASRAISNLCGATDRILISSAPFDYAEPTHVNVRSPEDWAAAFAAHGFVRNLNFDASFVTPWAALYERTDATLPELVRSYERKLFRLNREVLDVRTTVLALQGRLEKLLDRRSGTIRTRPPRARRGPPGAARPSRRADGAGRRARRSPGPGPGTARGARALPLLSWRACALPAVTGLATRTSRMRALRGSVGRRLRAFRARLG